MFFDKLPRTLAVGLLCSVPLSLSASISPRDTADAPLSAIAIKLNTQGLRTAQALNGTNIVEGLVSKARASSQNRKRDVDFTVLPLINSLSPERLAELVQRAVELDPAYVPADFGSWFQVQFEYTAVEADPEITELLERISENQEVASCQRLAAGPAPNVQPHDDPLFVDQHYITESDVGINAKYAWGFPGGDGSGTTVIDIERGWQLDHKDLVCIPNPLLPSQADHTTHRSTLASLCSRA